MCVFCLHTLLGYPHIPVLRGAGGLPAKGGLQSNAFYLPRIAGSFETEALGFGAIRVLKGEEEAKTYTGKPVWDGFSWDK